jgi:hypothetical protein
LRHRRGQLSIRDLPPIKYSVKNRLRHKRNKHARDTYKLEDVE